VTTLLERLRDAIAIDQPGPFVFTRSDAQALLAVVEAAQYFADNKNYIGYTAARGPRTPNIYKDSGWKRRAKLRAALARLREEQP